MQKTAMLFLSMCLLSLPSLSKKNPTSGSLITLDGEEVRVYFNDGDTFRVLEGEYRGTSVRIAGYNALETYGPIHSWGENTGEYLYSISQKATKESQKGGWSCELESGKDAYGRLLAYCDDLAASLLSKGLAHAYSINDEPADKSYLKEQKTAQKKKLGMWKGGVPDYIITSLHTADGSVKNTFNRLISAKDGHTKRWAHKDLYDTCDMICLEDEESCMVYVPFGKRYGKNKPKCLYTKK